jgi:hypothetical protein
MIHVYSLTALGRLIYFDCLPDFCVVTVELLACVFNEKLLFDAEMKIVYLVHEHVLTISPDKFKLL